MYYSGPKLKYTPCASAEIKAVQFCSLTKKQIVIAHLLRKQFQWPKSMKTSCLILQEFLGKMVQIIII